MKQFDWLGWRGHVVSLPVLFRKVSKGRITKHNASALKGICHYARLENVRLSNLPVIRIRKVCEREGQTTNFDAKWISFNCCQMLDEILMALRRSHKKQIVAQIVHGTDQKNRTS